MRVVLRLFEGCFEVVLRLLVLSLRLFEGCFEVVLECCFEGCLSVVLRLFLS